MCVIKISLVQWPPLIHYIYDTLYIQLHVHVYICSLIVAQYNVLYLVLFIIDTPKIVEHPQAQVLEVGNKLFLTCQAQGVGPLNYQWFRNGEALIYGTKQDLVINEVQMADQGVYVCCVKTSNGSSALTKGAEIVGQFVVVPPGLGVENKFLLFEIIHMYSVYWCVIDGSVL